MFDFQGRVSIGNAAPDLEFHPSADYFIRSLSPRGGAAVGVVFAGLGFRLEGLSFADEVQVRSRLGVFARAGNALPDAPRIEVVHADVPAFLRAGRLAQGLPELYRLEQFRQGNRLFVYSYDFAGWYDFSARKGQLALTSGADDFLPRALENYLRSVSAHRALEQDGFLLHGAGVVRNGCAHLFFGPSGSGKTTVTMLSEGALILGDDLMLIQEGEQGYRAWPVPFRGVFREPPCTEESFPLSAFYRLIQAPSDFLETLPPARGVAELLGSLPFVMEGGGGSRALGVVARAVAQVPVHRLHFRKSPDFWSLLEKRWGN